MLKYFPLFLTEIPRICHSNGGLVGLIQCILCILELVWLWKFTASETKVLTSRLLYGRAKFVYLQTEVTKIHVSMGYNEKSLIVSLKTIGP